MVKIMIAEDDLIIADMIEEDLLKSGYDVCSIARTVQEGLELNNQYSPEFAIIDFRLADEFGTDIIAGLDRKHTAVLLASGNCDYARDKTFGDACLAKPYSITVLKCCIEIVRKYHQSGELPAQFPFGFRIL